MDPQSKPMGPDPGYGLRPGDRHYRAYVGPPEDYDLIAGHQFGLLVAAGLREGHRFADVGCGSLRLGRLLIPYLATGRYFGIEPNRWLVEEGIERELGPSILEVKQPSFSYTDDFSLRGFGTEFDYVMAHSIFSHTYEDLMSLALRRIGESLAEEGTLFATFVEEGEPGGEGSGWLYPGIVSNPWPRVRKLIEDSGLVANRIDWPHPRQRWFVAAQPSQRARIEKLASRIQPPTTGEARARTQKVADAGSRRGEVPQLSRRQIEDGAHRGAVGGMWEEIGKLQFEFLKRHGLRPDQRLLDVGCGSLRGGVRFVGYLDSGNYHGIDHNPSLIRAGRLELRDAGIAGRRPVLLVDGEFDFSAFGTRFPVALAQSVFTHLDLNQIDRCLTNMADALEPGGRFFATYFEAPSPHHVAPVNHPGKTVTTIDADPYHYHFSDFQFLVRGLPLRVVNIGAWEHPHGQHMLEFTRE